MDGNSALLLCKAMHIIGVVAWFAGLFYLGRLFVYHREARDKGEPDRAVITQQLQTMERRLYYAITWPGMVVTLSFGGALTWWYGFPWWLQIKLGCVSLLVVYHFQCGALRNRLATDATTWTSRGFRMWNEVPTVLLVAIVFLAVMKESTDVIAVGLGLTLVGAAIVAIIRRMPG